MTQNIKQFIEEGEKELKHFVFESKEDENSIEHMDIGYKEFFEWYRSRQISLIKMIVEEILESLPDYKLNKGYMEYGDKKTFAEGWNMCKNEVRDTISSKLSKLTDGK